MNLQIDRQHKDQQIKIPVRTWNRQRIIIKVRHFNKPHTTYFDTAPIINGFDAFIIKIPKMPESVIVELYNEANGNLEKDTSFAIGKISIKPIRLNFAVKKLGDKTVASFAKFSDDFAENAGILSARNSIYLSPDGKFRIDYKDVIRNAQGKEMRTPARINTGTKIIEIAKKYYLQYTVPGRKAVNWHEFSHVWVNRNPANEMEADKNAIMIYLGTGNPTIEAYNVWGKIFNNTPSPGNKARYDEINSFIKKMAFITNHSTQSGRMQEHGNAAKHY